MYFNPKVFKELNRLQIAEGYTPTVVTSLSSKKVIELLVNPETIDVEHSLTTQTVDTFVYEKMFVNSKKSMPIKLSAILLNCLRYKVSLDGYLVQLRELLTPKNQTFERYSIIVGKKSFSPVIFTNLKISDTLRLGGDTVTALVELTGIIENSQPQLDKGLNKK